jgi:hypothetical protein
MKTNRTLSIYAATTLLAVLVLLGALLVGCGSSSSPITNFPIANSIPVTVPTVSGSAATFAFDIAAINGTKFYLTDRTNKALDVIDISTTTLSSILAGSFVGCQSGTFPPLPVVGTANPSCAGSTTNNDLSGPDGLNVIGSVLYVGDIDSVKIVDPVAQTVVKTLTITPTGPTGTKQGVRADEGCFDPDDNLYMINTPGLAYSTIINTTTQTVVAVITYADTLALGNGLEACAYDHATNTFYNNNDGSGLNPHGEVDVLTVADVKTLIATAPVAPATVPVGDYSTFAHLKKFPEGACDPTGLAMGPGNDLAVVCREGTTGQPLNFLIFDKTAATGTAPVKTLNAGGGDQLWYDPGTNRYYEAAGRWTATGTAATNGACSAALPCTPVLFVIDAAARTIVNTGGTPIGNGAHSIAVDPTTGEIFIPYAASSSSCSTCTANGFVSSAITVFKAK